MVKKLLVVAFVCSSCMFAQMPEDSTRAAVRHPYSSFGFNVSSVSALGLSYRNHPEGQGLFQLTAAIFTSGSSTYFSIGAEYQYELSKKESFRYYIPIALGLYSGKSSVTAAGLGIGLELPVIGNSIYESVTAGLELFYPTLYAGNGSSVSFGGSAFIFYNF